MDGPTPTPHETVTTAEQLDALAAARTEAADEQCDYCGDPLWGTFLMRAVGFTSLEPGGPQAPQVKTWCGECETPDDIDPEAHAAFKRAIKAQTP